MAGQNAGEKVRKVFKMKCKNCNYTYRIDVFYVASIEICPNCGYTAKLEEFRVK